MRPTLPLLIAIDEEGGCVSRLPQGFTTFPAASRVAACHAPDVAYEVAEVTARELRAVGINMNLAPVLDVNCNPANPIIGDRGVWHGARAGLRVRSGRGAGA